MRLHICKFLEMYEIKDVVINSKNKPRLIVKNLSINVGEKVAILGKSGAGKSSRQRRLRARHDRVREPGAAGHAVRPQQARRSRAAAGADGLADQISRADG